MTTHDERTRFTAFVAENRAALSRTAYLLTGDATTAQDLLQEALTRSYPRWGRIEPGREFAFVRRVMTNLRTDWWRRRRFEGPGATPVADGGAHDRAWSENGFDAVDNRDLIVQRLAPLTARERAVVVLRYYADLTETAVAEELGVTVGTVKSTCSRALARLAKESVS